MCMNSGRMFSTTYLHNENYRHYTMKRALILNYHALIGDESQLSEDRFSVRYSRFVQHMNLIQEHGIAVVSIEKWLNGECPHEFSILLTFDDGNESDYQLALPILKEMNFPATFFPFIDAVGLEHRMSWEMIKELSTLGFSIGSHGISHTDLRSVSAESMVGELRESKHWIEKKIGKPVHFFALPFGGNNRLIAREAMSAGYSRMLTTQRRVNFADGSNLLHRWNIKSTTSLAEFEKMLRLNQPFLTRKKITSSVNQLQSSVKIYVKNTLTSSRN